MSGQYIGTKRDDFVKTFKYFMENLTDADLARHSGKTHRGLDHYERKWLQIGVATKNEDILKEYRHNMIGDTYLDVPGLKEEMKGWKFPLHFIDFETSAVALPFYDKMRPYEQIAFQFSYHRVDMNEDGTYKVTHAGQFINTEKGHFPNFDFIRALKAELDQDEGTIFRYSHHENTILREIHRQLDASDETVSRNFMENYTYRTRPEIALNETIVHMWCGSKEPYAIKSHKILKKYLKNYREEIMEGLGHGEFLTKHSEDCCGKIHSTLRQTNVSEN